MKVILTQTVAGVGDAGAIKDVADGYARNFLLPRGLAVVATRGSVKQAEAQAELYSRKSNKAREETQKAASAVQDKTVIIQARSGSENRLYGSVTPADVAEALQTQHGITIDRRRIEVEPIHRLGTYTATADFGNGVTGKFTVDVAPEGAAPASQAASPSGAKAPKQGKAARPSTESEPQVAEGAQESAASEPEPAHDSLATEVKEPSGQDALDQGREALAEERIETEEEDKAGPS